MNKFNALSATSKLTTEALTKPMPKLAMALGLAVTLLTSGCATQNIQSYQNVSPTLDMHQFFSGQIDGWGMFQGRNGEVKKRFTVDINATHEGDDVIVLDEKFAWADGTKSQNHNVYGV